MWKGGGAEQEEMRSIPLSEGFEICFCLIVSEREIKRGRGEERRGHRQTDTQTEVQREVGSD